TRSGVGIVAGGEGAGGRGGVLADPLALPGPLDLTFVAAWLVHGGELVRDLLAMRGGAARDLVRRHVHLPAITGATYPAVRLRVPEREPDRGQVLGVPDIDHRVAVRAALGVQAAEHDVDGRRRGRGPAGKEARALERVAGEGAEPDHSGSSSSGLVTS